MPSTNEAVAPGTSNQAAGSSSAQAATAASASDDTQQQRNAQYGDSDSEEDDEDEQDWDDLDEEDEEIVKLPTKALFSDEILPHPEAVLEDAKVNHGVDLIDFIAKNRVYLPF
jgi:hypothetical protein